MFYWVFLLILLSSKRAVSHPVTFEDGLAFGQVVQPGMVLMEGAYSISPRLAFGGTFIRRQTNGPRLVGGFLNVNTLVFRRNGDGSQANLYAIGGMGYGDEDGRKPMGMAAIQADFETTRFYTALMGRMLGDEQSQVWQTTYRIGVAPYEAEFNDLQSWLVMQTVYAPDMQRMPNFSGLLRFFYRTVLWEVGGDLKGRPWIQLMVHY